MTKPLWSLYPVTGNGMGCPSLDWYADEDESYWAMFTPVDEPAYLPDEPTYLDDGADWWPPRDDHELLEVA